MPGITRTIGKFNAETRQVPVSFTMDGVTHIRNVNAVLTDKGTYDKSATAKRVDDVAIGVAHKIALGVITNPPADKELPAVESPAMPGEEPA